MAENATEHTTENTDDNKSSVLPKWALILVIVAGSIVVLVLLIWFFRRLYKRRRFNLKYHVSSSAKPKTLADVQKQNLSQLSRSNDVVRTLLERREK
jgi:hypothetical protein